jgi:O-acetylserine/cysteine efflux transporter
MPLRDSLLAVLIAVIWGVNFVVIDIGLAGMPPLLFLAVRFVVVLVPAIFLVPRPDASWRELAVVGLLMSAGQFAFMYTALYVGMPAGLASLVLQAQVLLTVLIAFGVLGERPTRAQVLGIVVGGAGLAVVGVGRSAATPLLALALIMAAALCWAGGNVASRRLGIASGLSMTVWSATVVPLPLFALSLLLDGPHEVLRALTHVPFSAVWSTAYTAYLASLVGYSIWNSLLAKHTAAAVVPFTLLVPAFGMLSAALVQGERPNTAETLGGVMLLVGVAVSAIRRLRRGGRPRGAHPPATVPGTHLGSAP